MNIEKKIREVIIKIRDVYRVKGRNINDSVVIATAYVLARSKRDISVSTRSLESFVKTADISSKAAEALERILGTSWDIVLECENKFDSEADTAECLKAAVVYYDLAEMHERPLFFTPASLVNLASRILDIKATDKVLDICSGIGQFPIYAINETEYAEYTGINIDQEMNDIAILRTDLLDGDYTFLNENVLTYSYDTVYDKIFSLYPIDLRKACIDDKLLSKIQEYFAFDSSLTEKYLSEWLYAALIILHLNDNGKAVMIVNNGVLTSLTKSANYMRRYFAENGYIEAVINLAANLLNPYTGTAVSMIIFSKNNRSVRLINAEDLVSKSETRGNQNYLSDDDIGKILDRLKQSGADGLYTIDLSPADMEEAKYDLMAYHYLDKGGRAFGLMMESIIRGSQIKSEALEQYKSDKPTKYRYITLSNIVNGSVEIEEGKQYLTELPEALKKFVIPDDSIVLSKMASPTFRSAVISSDNKCRYIATGNLYIIKLKTNNNIGNSEKRIAPNPYYIQAYLESAEGEAALERVSGGTSLKTISVEAVKNILIPSLPPEEEEEVAREYCQAQEEYNVLKRLMKTVLVKKRTLLEDRLEQQRRKDESADGQ